MFKYTDKLQSSFFILHGNFHFGATWVDFNHKMLRGAFNKTLNTLVFQIKACIPLLYFNEDNFDQQLKLSPTASPPHGPAAWTT